MTPGQLKKTHLAKAAGGSRKREVSAGVAHPGGAALVCSRLVVVLLTCTPPPKSCDESGPP